MNLINGHYFNSSAIFYYICNGHNNTYNFINPYRWKRKTELTSEHRGRVYFNVSRFGVEVDFELK